jgi:biotin transport system substrate-specific component
LYVDQGGVVSSLATQPRTTLVDVLLPRQRSWAFDAALIVAFSAFVALTARIQIPLWPVPITLQTLAVLFTGAALGSRRGALALLLYLTEGAVGLPVFAGGAGLAYMLGPTGGYLISYPIAAGLVGLLAEHGWDRRPAWMALAMVIGNLVIYALGVTWLAVFLGHLSTALVSGMLIFVVGDLIKIAIAALALPGGWALARRRRRAGEHVG